MEIITFIVVLILFAILAFAIESNSKSKKGALMDGIGKVASIGGNTASSLGERLKSASIESDIKKINLGAEFRPQYQLYNSLLMINVVFNYDRFKKNEISEKQKIDLLVKAKLQDEIIAKNIIESSDFYNTCKNLGILNVDVLGCRVYANDDRVELKTRNLVKGFIVGKYSFEEKVRI